MKEKNYTHVSKYFKFKTLKLTLWTTLFLCINMLFYFISEVFANKIQIKWSFI